MNIDVNLITEKRDELIHKLAHQLHQQDCPHIPFNQRPPFVQEWYLKHAITSFNLALDAVKMALDVVFPD
jgi:hypothetical protein